MSNVSVQYEKAYVAEVRIKTDYTILCTPSFPLGKGPNGEEHEVLSQIVKIEELAQKHEGQMLRMRAKDGDDQVIMHVLFRSKEKVEDFKEDATTRNKS